MRLIAFLALSALPLTVLGDTADDVRTRLMERYPSTPVDTVRTTPIAGLFEVAMGRKIVYVDATGQYFLFGRIFDLPGNRDLTEDRLRDISRLDVSLIQPDQVLEQGGGSQVVYVFSDPACGHCKKLEQTLAGMPTLMVRTILLPLQPGSSDLARDIWCTPDRQRAWSAWMLKGTRLDRAPETCQASVLERNLALAKRFGIRATPALVSPDGRVSMGAMEAPALSAWLNPDQTAVTTVATEASK
ncbi:MAG: DsbC family protein [Hydrogenophilales bacterium]|jgi:thiol:disulfide interchange protein DsbC|nr:DsbC family protein [Hydrogenophilales bacterium]